MAMVKLILLAALCGIAAASMSRYTRRSSPLPNPCLSKPCQWGGLCRPTPDGVNSHECVCRKGFSGRRCEVLPIPSTCGFHVKGTMNFHSYFTSAHRRRSDDQDYLDVCTDSRLVLATHVDNFCARDFYMSVSHRFANDGSFVYVSARGPVFVHVGTDGAMNITQMTYRSNYARLIKACGVKAFPIVKICVTPKHDSQLVGIPYAVKDAAGADFTCDKFGLKRHLYQGFNKVRLSMASIVNYYNPALPSGPLYFYLDVHSKGRDRFARVFKFTRTQPASLNGFPYGRMTLSHLSPPNVTIAMALCDRIDMCAGSPCSNGGACQNMAVGYACFCHHGYTGRNCDRDTAEIRGTCGQRTLYVTGHQSNSPANTLSIRNVMNVCFRQHAALPSSENLSTCERKFLDSVSVKLFKHSRYMYYSVQDDEISDASLTKQITSYFHGGLVPHAIICQGVMVNQNHVRASVAV